MKKKVKRIAIKLWLAIKEKKYINDDVTLKYLFFKGEGDILLISFSAYNEKPLYNYIRTLKKVKFSRLYIKDDFGPNQKGSYYLGEKGKQNVEPAVIELINKKIKDRKLSPNAKLIFIGSSKGGYAALNFAVRYNNSYAIVGAPQYLLGTHLNRPCFYGMLEDIVGKRTLGKIDLLDQHIREKYIKKNKNWIQHVFLQYSNKEYTYEWHIKKLIEDLENTNIITSYDVQDYIDHADVHKLFPAYLNEKIKLIINA